MKNKKINELYENKFVKSVLEKGDKIISEQKIEKGKDGKIKSCRNKLTEKEKYIVDTFQGLTELIGTFEDIENIKIYLKQFPSNKSYKKFKITRDQYLIYHIENYYIRSVSLSDKLALLINQVYKIRLNPRDAKLDILLRTDILKNTHITKIINYYESKIQNKIKSTRNLIIHRLKYYDEELIKLATFSLINSINDKMIISPLVYKLSYKFYIEKWIKKINSHLKILILYLSGIFKQLDEVFDDNLLQYSK